MASTSDAARTQARLALHYGAWVLGSAAHSLLQHRDDDSHTNLGVDTARGELTTWPLAPDGLAFGLHAQTLTLRAHHAGHRGQDALALTGRTMSEALAWCAARAGRSVARRAYPDFPDSPILDGGAFPRVDSAHLRGLWQWFTDAQQALDALAAEESKLSERRVWPHHFDLGALLDIEGEQMVGLGASLGDDFYDEPYWYCSPFPEPEDTAHLPTLRYGHWHTDDMVSAIFTSSELAAAGGTATTVAAAYLRDAVAAGRRVIGA